jgi:hypothetical protein
MDELEVPDDREIPGVRNTLRDSAGNADILAPDVTEKNLV